MHSCPDCNSTDLQKRGTNVRADGTESRQYMCKNCGKRFQKELPKVESSSESKAKRFVLTYYQPYTDYDLTFYNNLKFYAKENGAELYVLTREFDEFDLEANPLLNELNYDGLLKFTNFTIGSHINVFPSLKISPNVMNPLSGVDVLSKGKSVIIGHSTLQFRTVPVYGDAHPIMLHTTGCISKPDYDVNTKSGAKAENNHSFSALVIELDDVDGKEIFHFRVLNADADGNFYDLTNFYKDAKEVLTNQRIEAIVLGDTHVSSMCPDAYKAVFKDPDSIINTTKPRIIVHHDVLDFNQIGSHHVKSAIDRYKKYIDGRTSVVAELNETVNFIKENTPSFVEKNIIVSSNHNDHLTVWLENDFDKRYDMINLKIYHFLMYNVLNNIEAGNEVNPFKYYFESFCTDKNIVAKTEFLGRDDLYYIQDILVSSHGDRSLSGGAKFANSCSTKMGQKMIVGHQHSPAITGDKNLFVVGTMTPRRLDYTSGTATGWMNTVAIIHQNGSVQLINVVDGKYKL